MNNIQFLLNKYSGLSGDDGKDYLVVDILVDHHPLTDFQWFATDFGVLKESTERDGFFYILTCWCGDHGCAGLKKQITVVIIQGSGQVEEYCQKRRNLTPTKR